MGFNKFLLLLCFVVSGTAHAAPAILVFGDSLSAGYGLAAHQAWPDLLQQRLDAGQRKWQVVNASISGETSAGGLSRLPAALAQYKPAVVILALGANDGLRGLPLAAMHDNLNSMILQIRQSGARTLLVGVRLPPNYGIAYTEKFQQTFADLAQQHHVALLPSLLAGVESRPELFQADGLHPIASAENQVMENVWKVLLPLLAAKH
ncbi:MAG: arylesterase [Sulfuriferula sp.]|nr:arylesterase [Sulfuriferula sp.]